MKKKKIILVLVAWMSVLPMMAKKPAVPTDELSVEERQQFTYYWYAARQAIEEERFSDAYTLLEFCQMINPNDSRTLYCLGVMYQSLGKQDLALQTFEKAYSMQPKSKGSKRSKHKGALPPKEKADVDLLEQLKRIYLSQGQWPKAIEMQDRLDEVNGYDAMSAITRYQIYALWNKPQKAMEAIDEYLKIDPTNLRFMLFRVELLEKTGAKQKVLYKQYEEILALDPGNLMILNNYAYHLATHGGDLKRAERMSEITIREQPNNPVFLDTYAWIMHLQGQNELAKFYLNRALWSVSDEATKTEIEKHLREIEK